jgi:uncharacterized RDD family membrane protein YckC
MHGPIVSWKSPLATAPHMARFSTRARAYLADLVIVALLVMVGLTISDLVNPVAWLGKSAVWLGMIVLLLYEPLLLHFCGGTIGHQLQGLVVIGADGRYLSFGSAVVRTTVKWLTITYFGPFMLRMGRRPALWDLPVRSMVCERRALAQRATPPTPLPIDTAKR